jgi:hypothetical protein
MTKGEVDEEHKGDMLQRGEKSRTKKPKTNIPEDTFSPRGFIRGVVTCKVLSCKECCTGEVTLLKCPRIIHIM